ncbi:MAG TPA: methylmalonyl Co-A mutase-associated GTPase MeaB [Burkholderiales bacterium]|nr:methylmalonyl Co-A mutase-associated GTPase MeaB [Burkholderiales bacterium]
MTEEDQALVDGVRAGERRALARAITLLESTHPEHRARAEAVLEALHGHAGRSLRIAISGPPGVGKSTFIESLGLHVLSLGHRLAVLAIDPSSGRTGGAILGDKTRMEQLSRDERAFIRPSPAGASLGGVAERTREAIIVCEAAGYDVIVVETVGVGQSQTAAAGMVDAFVLMQLPNAGDDLQALKKGIVELADLFVVNKADLDAAAARAAAGHIEMALGLLRPSVPQWRPPVLLASGLSGSGIAEFWEAVRRYERAMRECGEFEARRRRQALEWMWALIDSGLREGFRRHPAVERQVDGLGDAVRDGRTTPVAAAAILLRAAKEP